MKRIGLYISLLFGIVFTGCDKLPDELFEQSVVITKNGFQEWELEYTEAGEIATTLPFSASGTSDLASNVTVDLTVDIDTLEAYNFEKYRNSTALYYDLLPEDCYELESSSVTLEAGSEYTLLPITFNIDKIDKYEDYVLPLTISSASGASIGKAPYNTILMSIVLSNNYSGTYSSDATLEDFTDRTTLNLTQNRKLRVIDHSTVYFYAGNVSEDDEDKSDYIVQMTVNEDSTLTLNALNPDIELEADESNIEDQINVVEQVVTADPKDHSKEYVLTKFYLSYEYKDISNPNFPTTMRFDGYLLNNKTRFDYDY